MNTMFDYWFVIVGLGCLLFLCIYCVFNFSYKPSDKKLENVKEWLKYAVTEAEKRLGSGTGSIKLRYVYDMCITKFPWIARVVTFATFSAWVDEALVWMKEQLDKNSHISDYVGEGEE